MYIMQEVRKGLDIAQWELGYYLRLSEEMISSIEQGRRHLPVHTGTQLLKLYNATQAIKTEGMPEEAPPLNEEKHIKQLKRRFRKCRRMLREANDALTKAREKYETRLFALACLNRAEHDMGTPTDIESQDQLKWVKGHKKYIELLLRINSPTQQNLLSTKIAGLEAEATALEALLEDADS